MLASCKEMRLFLACSLLEKNHTTLIKTKSEGGENVNTKDVVQHDDPDSSIDDLEEEVSDLPLERCMRIVPHDQNTWAFFIDVSIRFLICLQFRTSLVVHKGNFQLEMNCMEICRSKILKK